MILNSEEAKMFALLKYYGLNQHVSIFLQQEVNIIIILLLYHNNYIIIIYYIINYNIIYLI